MLLLHLFVPFASALVLLLSEGYYGRERKMLLLLLFVPCCFGSCAVVERRLLLERKILLLLLFVPCCFGSCAIFSTAVSATDLLVAVVAALLLYCC